MRDRVAQLGIRSPTDEWDQGIDQDANFMKHLEADIGQSMVTSMTKLSKDRHPPARPEVDCPLLEQPCRSAV